MAEYTENLNLELPEHFEYFKLAVWNGNSAKIDEFAGTVNAHMENMNNPHQVTAEQIGAASAALVTAMQADVAFAKSQVEEITAYEKYITFGLIDGEYVELNGTITSYAGWKRSDYLEIPEDAATLRFDTGSSTYNDKYNCFYDENKNFISAFTIHKGDSETVSIPEAAKYVIFSGNNNFILQLRVSYESHGIGGVRENLGLPFTLKVMSYNVGMWSDGTSEGVPAEDVEQKAVEWHRFLGKYDPDFLLLEEAVEHFDEDKTVNAYSKILKFKYPYEWHDTNTTHPASTKEVMLLSKYPLDNVRVHAFASGSNRAFITFDATICGRKINFVVVHLSIEASSSGERQQDMEEIAALIKTYAYGIVTGDFNAYSITEFDTHFADFDKANHGAFGDFPTWDHEQGGWNKCLDNVIVGRNAVIQNVEMGSVQLSDHEPIMATLRID